MENNYIENSEVFNSLSLLYRDTTLPGELISKYKVGKILNERGFTDMSTLGGGLATNLRYLIATSNAKDVSGYIAAGFYNGHMILHSNAFFKVLDVYKVGDQMQIFLLELPETAIKLFSDSISEKEMDLIKKARQDFDILLTFPPEPALQNADWQERTSFPIGMNENGEFFLPE